MNKKTYFSLLIFLFSIYPLVSFSQSKKEDVVYLKNGNIIHGNILEIIPAERIKIQTLANDIFVFEMNEVEKIVLQLMNTETDERHSIENHYRLVKTFLHEFDVGYHWGVGKSSAGLSALEETHQNNFHAFSFRFVEAYKFLKNSSMGFGVGYESYLTDDKTFLPATNYIPLFAHARTSFSLHGKVLPGIAIDFGYDIGLTDESGFKFQGGPFINPAFCIQVKTSPTTFLYLYFGYKYESHSVAYESADLEILLSSHYMTFRTGIEF